MAYFLRFAEAALLSLLVCGVAGAPPAAEKGQNGRRSDQKADEKARARAEPEADDEADPHVGLLKDAKIDTENANLIAYLKKHSQTDDDLQHLNRLVRQLGAPDFHERERASASLVKLGLVALATVREARTDANQEVARRAKDCVEQIEKESEHNVPLAVVRVLARRTPPGTFESLLNYLPFSIDQDVEEEIYRGLDRIAKKDGDGKARGALQNALKDDLPARRALAGCLLGRLGDEKQRIAVKGLLTDKEPIVRLRSAQGLLASGHLDAIPILIQLLEDASLDVAWQAEELLHCIAGSNSPTQVIGNGSKDARRSCSHAWNDWKSHASNLIDTHIDPKAIHRPRLLLICETTGTAGERGRIWLCGGDGSMRFEITTQNSLYYAQLLRNNRILIADSEDVFERATSESEMEFSLVRSIRGPIHSCRRMSNGDTFLFDGRNIQTVNSREYEQDAASPDDGSPLPLRMVHKLDTGHTLVLTHSHSIVELSNNNKVLRELNIHMPDPGRICGAPDAVTNGHVLLPLRSPAAFVELDDRGQILAERNLLGCTQPNQVTRLPCGNTIAVCRIGMGGERVLEMNREGKAVWEVYTTGTIANVQPCLTLVRLGFDGAEEARVDLDSLESTSSRLKAKSRSARFCAIQALAQCNSKERLVIANLAELLGSSDKDVRDLTREILAKKGKAAVGELVSLLRNEKAAFQTEVIDTLMRMDRSAASEAIPSLTLALENDNPDVRFKAAMAIGVIGTDSNVTILRLRRMLSDERSQLSDRLGAAMSLGEIGVAARGASDVLIGALKDKDDQIRISAVTALARINPNDDGVITAIVDSLSDESPRVQLATVYALARVGPGATSAFPKLIKSFLATTSSSDEATIQLQVGILQALSSIDPKHPDVQKLALAVLKDSSLDYRARKSSAYALEMAAADSAEIRAVLEEVTGNADWRVALAATEVLKRVKRKGRD